MINNKYYNISQQNFDNNSYQIVTIELYIYLFWFIIFLHINVLFFGYSSIQKFTIIAIIKTVIFITIKFSVSILSYYLDYCTALTQMYVHTHACTHTRAHTHTHTHTHTYAHTWHAHE